MDSEQRKKEVLAYFDEHDIRYELHEHAALFTYADVKKLGADVPGMGSKNLFLRNRKGDRHFLYVIPGEKRADLAAFAEHVGERKVIFASDERLKKYLGIEPGSVSLAGLLHDTDQDVEVFIDQDLLDAPLVHLHPNTNTASLALTHDAFQKFLDSLSHQINSLSL